MRALRLVAICIVIILVGTPTVNGTSHPTAPDTELRAVMQALQLVHKTEVVLGSPLEIEGFKIIPLATVGMGYGQKLDTKAPEPMLGAAGLVSPVGIVVVSSRGVQLLPVSKGFLEQFLGAITPIALQVLDKQLSGPEGVAGDFSSQPLWPTVLARLYTLLPENGLKFGLFPWPLGLVLLFIAGWLALALLAGVFLPQQVSTVAMALEADVLRTGLVGILSYGVAFMLAIVFGASIIGIPLSILVLAFIWALTLLGMISIASIVGRRSAMAMRRSNISPIVGILMGGVILGAVRVIPLLGWVAWLVLGIFGFGAVLRARSRAVRQAGQGPTGA